MFYTLQNLQDSQTADESYRNTSQFYTLQNLQDSQTSNFNLKFSPSLTH